MNPPVQIQLPQTLINNLNYSNSTWIPLANIQITDTNIHSYLSDPNNIAIVRLGNILGSEGRQLSSFAVWIYNGENQTLTVTPITNIVNDGSYPDIPITTPSNTTGNYTLNPNTPLWNVYNFDNYSIEFLSLQLSFATAPTSGSVLASLYLYYR